MGTPTIAVRCLRRESVLSLPMPLTPSEDRPLSCQRRMEKTEAEAETEKQQNNVVAKGLSSMVSSLMEDYDSKAEDALRSQLHLSSSLDRLTGELDQLLEDAPAPFIMQYAGKISSVRKRVSSLNSVLKSIHQRLDNMDHMLSQSMLHSGDKAAPEFSEHQSSGK